LRLVVAVRNGCWSGSELDAAAATKLSGELALEVHEAAEAEEASGVLLAAESAQHSGEVVDGGDLWAESASEWFAVCAAAQVVVAARACRFGDELELAGARLELHDRPLEAAEVEPLAVGTAGIEVF
jgi:hypothetical protein